MTKTLTEQQIKKIIENGTGKAAKVCKQKFYGKPKSLTEQWREGKLPEDTYYVRFICGRYGVYEFEQYKGFGFDNDLAYIKEVVATVPSYDKVKEMSQKIERLEFDNEALEMAHNEGKEINAELVSKTEQLEKKLAIATKALKDVAYLYIHTDKDLSTVANNALKEMKGVK